jgi:hypothetical protein
MRPVHEAFGSVALRGSFTGMDQNRATGGQVITACRDSTMIDWARSPQTDLHWRKSCLAVRTQVCLVPSPFLTRTTSSSTCATAALRFSGASAAHL